MTAGFRDRALVLTLRAVCRGGLVGLGRGNRDIIIFMF